jgi:hypothetical protein
MALDNTVAAYSIAAFGIPLVALLTSIARDEG